MSAVQEFVDILGEFKGLKSGISGSRIKKLTDLAVSNSAQYQELVRSAAEAVKNATDSHKLGALYVLDSIARAYQDAAAKGDANAQAGLRSINDVIKESLTTTLKVCPPEHKEKTAKLIAIWRRRDTFDRALLDAVDREFFGREESTTPKSAPPPLSNAPMSADALLKNLASLQQPPAPSSSGPDPREAIAQLVSTMQNNGELAAFMQQQLSQQQQQQQNYGQSPPQQYGQPQQQYGSQQYDQQQQQQPSQEDLFRATRDGGRDDRRGNGFSRRPRSRSPQRNARALPPPGHVIGEKNIPGTAHYREKNVQLDPNLPYNSIKVLSRTLFVGGIPAYMNSDELKNMLRPYAEVQSVILNAERKHAFVKAYSRQEAVNVIENFQEITAANLRVRWGVGYGPRDCCDYIHGVSIIPIDRLTDADKRWINSAEWGGVGMERPLVPNLVMEEPDIEIGEGVSSKAISKKMPTDASRNGPRSNRPGEQEESYATTSAQLPSFMQNNNNKENPLANLFGGAAAAPQAVQAAAPAAGGDANAQLANLMAMLQKQQGA